MRIVKWIKIKATKKLSLTFFLTLQLLLSRVEKTYSQNSFEYELHNLYSDAYFYNVKIFENNIVIGSDRGIYMLNNLGEISLIDSLQKGYVYIEQNSLKCLPHAKLGMESTQYNDLLPLQNRSQSNSGEAMNNIIAVVSMGKLFVYKTKWIKKLTPASIRSISKNYIGTYDGIYYKNKLLPYPTYTNGYIREFEKETFICYDGLTRFSNNEMKIIDTDDQWKKAVGNYKIREVRDIQKINDTLYLLFCLNGILETNLNGKSRWIFKNNNDSEIRFVSNKKTIKKNTSEVIFVNNRKAYNYNINNKKLVEILEIENKLGEIRDISFNNLGKIYMVTSEKLLMLEKQLDNSYKTVILDSNLVNNHNIIRLNENFIITSNSGISYFNTKINKISKYVIKDEFNDKAIYKDLDSIHLGTTNGYYSFNIPDLEKIINSINPIVKDKAEPYTYNYKTSLIVTLVLLIISFLSNITLILLIKYKYKNHIALNQKQLSKEKIVNYIDLNLSKVTVTSVMEHFNVKFNDINKELKTIRIGQLIRERRISTIKNMRKKMINEESISIATGFSISYLKKIK